VKNLQRCLILAALVTALFSTFSCSKSNNNSTSVKDSVLYSNWAPLKMSLLGVNPQFGDSVYGQAIPVKAITRAVLDRGLVLTYIQGIDNNGDTLIQNAEVFMNQRIYAGEIDLFSEPNDYTGYNFRYVIIPGRTLVNGVSGQVETYTPAQLRSMSYPTIAKMLRLSADQPSSGVLPLRNMPATRLNARN